MYSELVNPSEVMRGLVAERCVVVKFSIRCAAQSYIMARYVFILRVFFLISFNGFNLCFTKWYNTGYLQYFYSLQFNVFILFIFKFFFFNIAGCVALEYHWNGGVYGIWLGCGWPCSILKMYLKNLVTSTVFM